MFISPADGLSDHLPDYVLTSIGEPDFGNMAERIRAMAAVLLEFEQTAAAEHLACAYGVLRATMAARGAD